MNEIKCTLALRCPKTWDELSATSEPKVRFCEHCSQNVYWAGNQQEVDRFAAKAKCVAFQTLEYAILGRPAGPLTDYSLVVLKQDLIGKKLAAFKKIMHSDLPYLAIKEMYHQKEVIIEFWDSFEGAENLRQRLEAIDVVCEIRETTA
ncbi:MAG: hypothetical protein K1Y36_08715 [Blastocatellia bacterium]|nr:hypothetical protein [Blastocatellia bacterium]